MGVALLVLQAPADMTLTARRAPPAAGSQRRVCWQPAPLAQQTRVCFVPAVRRPLAARRSRSRPRAHMPAVQCASAMPVRPPRLQRAPPSLLVGGEGCLGHVGCCRRWCMGVWQKPSSRRIEGVWRMLSQLHATALLCPRSQAGSTCRRPHVSALSWSWSWPTLKAP